MSDEKHKPYVPDDSTMSEFTVRALLLGLVMSVVLGAANAYLGLRAGMTIAATYPAAVIGMAVLRMMKGSLLEENFARTVGSIGESVAAGAIFTIPAFVILQIWSFQGFDPAEYLTASALMIVGGILGVLFVTVLRRVMVEDRSLPFPESVAASEIHKAGQRGAEAAMQLFSAMGVGALIKLLGDAGVFRASNEFHLAVGRVKESFVRLGLKGDAATIPAGGATTFQAPGVSPAYLGVGYIIGPELGALNFAGGLLAWGLFVPLLIFFLGPELAAGYTGADGVTDWAGMAGHVWRFIVRPIAVGGMLVGASYTLFRMRKNLATGIKRGDRRREEVGGRPRGHRPHRAGPLLQDRPRRDRGRVRADDRALLLLHEGPAGGVLRRDRHAGHRLLLRRGVRQPRRHDRLVQQPDLGPHPRHHDRGRAHHGDRRREGRGRAWPRCSAWPPSSASPPPSPARCCRT